MAKAHGCGPVRLLGVTGRKRADLLIGTALQATCLLVLAFPASGQPAPNAQPAGGVVAAGSAAITQSPNSTTISQASPRAIINWQNFSVGSQQSVTFAQPSTSAVTLNRVTGPDPSQIAGKIDANGQVVLVNQAGVTFYKGSQVNAQSLVVTTANVSDANFMAGNMAFSQAGNPNASVVNQGTITVRQAGLAALVAPSVANSGVINARLGHVILAGAKTSTLDLYGDGLLSLDVTNQVTQTPMGPNGATVATLATNSGVIRASGGTVQLTAAAADGVLQNLVQAGGKVSANSVGTNTGTVTIAGIGGSVTVTGLVRAAGAATGGQVAINATDAVTLNATARVNASGAAGGGTVAIGTTLQRASGGPATTSTMTAANVTVLPGARVSASAKTAGNGGRVTVLSGNTTQMAGTITASGGAQAGNGGFVEISGPQLGLTGVVDVSAPAGSRGTILLDPSDLAIISSTSTTSSSVDGEFTIGGGTLLSTVSDGSPLPSTISSNTLNTWSGNVVVQATGTIDVRAPITNLTGGMTLQAGSTLTLESGASIVADANMLLQAGTKTPSGALVLNADVISEEGSVQLIAGTGGIMLNGNLHGLTVDLSATGGGVTQTSNVGITANTLQSSNGVTGSVSLLGTNSVTNVGNFTVTAGGNGGDFQLINTDASSSNALNVSGSLATPGGNVYLQSPTFFGVSIGSGAAITTGTSGRVSIQGDLFNINGGSITTGTLELAPFTTDSFVLLGTQQGDGGLSLISMTGINAGLVRVGAITEPGASSPTILAQGIATGADFDAANTSLELDNVSGGTVAASGGRLLNVATLSGTADGWNLPLSNSITALGTINLINGFTLTNIVPLTLAGAVNGGTSVSITNTGAMQIIGTVSASSVSLSADSIDIPGKVTDGGAGFVSLTAKVGTITETGTLIAGLLVGSAVGTADLTGASVSANQVGEIGGHIPFTNFNGGFSASSFALRDGASLAVGGVVSATSSTGQTFLSSTAPSGITIAPAGAIQANASTGTASLQTDELTNNSTVAGGLTAGTVELAPATSGGTVILGAFGEALSLFSTGGLTTTNLRVGAVTLPGAASPTITAGAVTIAGTFNATGLATLELDASTAAGTGAVTQSAPLINVGVLLGTTASTILSQPGNTVGTLGNYTASSGFTLNDAEALLIAGTVAAGPSATFTVSGALTESGGITANIVSGSAVGTVSFTGNNVIGDINGFTVSGGSSTFTVTDTGNLLIDGTLSATSISISDPASQLSLDNGADIVTSGNFRPAGVVSPSSPLLPQNGGPGAFFQAASFVQIGVSTITGTPSTLQISVTGNMQFDPPLGLSGPGTWLIMNLTNGSAAGNVFINALDVIYSVPGSANLNGTINNIAGTVAAASGFIQPTANLSYLFNGCQISTTPCVAPSSPSVPAVTPPPVLPVISIPPALPSPPPSPPPAPPPVQPIIVTPPVQPAPPAQPLLVIVPSQPAQPNVVASPLVIQPLLPTETEVFVPLDALLALVIPTLVLEPADKDNLLDTPVVSREDY